MSIRLMSVVWDVPFPTSTQMLIALKLADYANDAGTSIYPANETLADKARCSETTVKTTLKVLRDCGLLVLVKQGGSGPRSTNEWALNVPMLKALASGICTIEGCSTVLEISGDCPVDNKGSNSDPLADGRGQSDGLRGQSTSNKGSAHGPQSFKNHQIESPDREGAKKVTDLDLKGSGKVQAGFGAFTVTMTDPQWSAWIAHLSEHDPDAAEDALAAGVIQTAGSRWPGDGVGYAIKKTTPKLTDRSTAMSGGK